MKTLYYLWPLPFLGFVVGYYGLFFLVPQQSLKTPNLMGLSLGQAIKNLSAYNLNLKIIGQKEDVDLPEDTIIKQSPMPGQSIKPQQSISCTISYKKPPIKASSYTGKFQPEILQQIKELSIHKKIYKLHSQFPQNYCFAQTPEHDQSLEEQGITLYISEPDTHILIPSFIGKKIDAVLSKLKEHTLAYKVIHNQPINDNHSCANCIIINQKPLPGTIGTLNQLPTIQLQVTQM